MAIITSASIEIDISKLKSSIQKCVRSIRGYKKVIKEKREEKEELQRLVENPGEYDVEALKRNVDACDFHVEEFEVTIEGERRAINHYSNIIKVLEEKKCQLEMMLQ